jgi:hypothetical protein
MTKERTATGLHHDRRLPAILMEQMIIYNSKLDTSQLRNSFARWPKAALARAGRQRPNSNRNPAE